jgi:hypothetical protein
MGTKPGLSDNVIYIDDAGRRVAAVVTEENADGSVALLCLYRPHTGGRAHVDSAGPSDGKSVGWLPRT